MAQVSNNQFSEEELGAMIYATLIADKGKVDVDDYVKIFGVAPIYDLGGITESFLCNYRDLEGRKEEMKRLKLKKKYTVSFRDVNGTLWRWGASWEGKQRIIIGE